MKDEIQEVIRNTIKGDLAAFRSIVDRYSQSVYNIAYRITGDSIEAQDIAQDVFIKLYQSLNKYDPHYSFTSWLYRIAVNIAIDHNRSNKRFRFISLENFINKPVSEDNFSRIEQNTEKNELKGAIQRLMVKLSAKQQKVFVLRDLQGFPTGEIAQILQCKPATVRVHLANARLRLRKELMQNYPELCAGKI